jgi:hypothetical protein
MTLDEFRKRYSQKCLYHFTDTRNLPSIRDHGGLLSLAELRRRNIDVEAAGGNDWSHDVDERCGLDTYVHLCFCNSHPMHYAARTDGRIQKSTFLKVHLDVLAIPGVRWTAEVANKSGVQLLDWTLAGVTLDFEVIYERLDWKVAEIYARRQVVEKYEILVPKSVPLSLIGGL